VTGAGPLPGE
jgi:hypothetical protein